MLKLISALALVVALCGAAFSEGTPERLLEEAIVISPVIVGGKVTKAAGEFKDGAETYKKFEVKVAAVLRASATGPAKDATITVYDSAALKDGDDVLLFLGEVGANGHRINRVLASPTAEQTKDAAALLELESKAEKELDGKDKLRAAFFAAHKLRPVLLAAATDAALKPAGAIPEADKDKLLAVLGWAFQESNKKETPGEFKRLAESLLRVLAGDGGLPDVNVQTRQERIAQFWGAKLLDPKQRAEYKLTKLTIFDKAAAAKQVAQIAAGMKLAIAIQGGRGQVIIAGVGTSGAAQPVKPPTPAAKPAPLPGPKDDEIGRVVNGLALKCRTENELYNFLEKPNQTITVTAAFQNTAAAAIRLNTYILFPALAEVFIDDPTGKRLVHADRARLDAAELLAMGTWSFKELKPGETVQFTEKLPAALFARNGQYKLCIKYKNNYGRQFGIGNAWTGEVVSDRIVVKVIRQAAGPEPEAAPLEAEKPEPTKPAAQPAADAKPGAAAAIQVQGGMQGTVQIEVRNGNGLVERRVVVNGQEVLREQKKDGAK